MVESAQTPPTGVPDERPDTTDVAQQRGREVAGEARQRGQQVADTTREEAGRVVDEATTQAAHVMETARQELHHQARQQTDHAGDALAHLGQRVQALADGRREDAGPVGDYAERIADQVQGLARRVDELGFDGLIEETQRFARRRPGAFLIGAAAAGFAVSRLGRGVKDDSGGAGASRPQGPRAEDATRPRDAGVRMVPDEGQR